MSQDCKSIKYELKVHILDLPGNQYVTLERYTLGTAIAYAKHLTTGLAKDKRTVSIYKITREHVEDVF